MENRYTQGLLKLAEWGLNRRGFAVVYLWAQGLYAILIPQTTRSSRQGWKLWKHGVPFRCCCSSVLPQHWEEDLLRRLSAELWGNKWRMPELHTPAIFFSSQRHRKYLPIMAALSPKVFTSVAHWALVWPGSLQSCWAPGLTQACCTPQHLPVFLNLNDTVLDLSKSKVLVQGDEFYIVLFPAFNTNCWSTRVSFNINSSYAEINAA